MDGRRWVRVGMTVLAAFALGSCRGGDGDFTAAAEAAAGPAPSATAASTTEIPLTTTTVASTTTLPPTSEPSAVVPPAPTSPPVTYTVSHVVDGDTVDVVGSDGTGFTVRLIGIDAAEAGACGADEATAAMTALVGNGEPVVLVSGARDDRDKYDRLLRYLDVNGVDVGLKVIEAGLAIARYDSRDGYGSHPREPVYVAADSAAVDHSCSPPTTQPPPPPPPTTQAQAPPPAPPAPAPTDGGNGCDPNYTGCVPIDSDVDCAGGSGNGPSYADGPVRVVGTDIYGLDRDGDGVGCE